MLERLKNWLRGQASPHKSPENITVRQSGAHYVQPRPRAAAVRPPVDYVREPDEQPSFEIEDGGPGKNVFRRSQFVREDAGTHETLTIVNESLIDSDDETGIDPYNTGGFDRSNNWKNRFRK